MLSSVNVEFFIPIILFCLAIFVGSVHVALKLVISIWSHFRFSMNEDLGILLALIGVFILFLSIYNAFWHPSLFNLFMIWFSFVLIGFFFFLSWGGTFVYERQSYMDKRNDFIK